MSERKLRRMSRTELIDVIDTLRQDETPQDTEALRRVDISKMQMTKSPVSSLLQKTEKQTPKNIRSPIPRSMNRLVRITK